MSIPRAAADPARARIAPLPKPRRSRAAALAPWVCGVLALPPADVVQAQAVVPGIPPPVITTSRPEPAPSTTPSGGSAAAAPAAPAAPTAPAAPLRGDLEELFASVRSNGVDRGEFRLGRTHDGDIWIRASDLEALEVQPRTQAQHSADGESWYSAQALGATSVRFDEATLTLSIDFRAETLAGTRVDLSQRPAAMQPLQPHDSLVLSYRLSALHSARGMEAVVAADLNVRVGGLLLRQETRLDTAAPGAHGFQRGVTQLVHDDLKDATRLTVGDVVSSAGPYGSTITGAGVQFAKIFDLAPDLIRQPTASIQAATALPADVEVRVDGNAVYRGRVAPGPIALDHLLLNGGTRNVQVVITDAAGRRQVIDQPFLFTDSVLAPGLHEYSYFAGKRSQLGLDNDWHDAEPAWQFFHRYGASGSVTMGVGGEGGSDFHNLGAGLTLRSDPLGLLSVDLLTSRDRRRHEDAHGYSARYTWLSPAGTVVLGRRAFQPGFRSFAVGLADPFPREETRVGLSTHLGQLTLSADYVRTVTDADVRDTGFLRVGAPVGRGMWLLGEWQTTRLDDRKGWAANVYLRADLDGQRWVSTTAHAENGLRRIDAEAGRQLPEGEGYGYRVGTGTTWTQGGRLVGVMPYAGVDANLPHAYVSLFGTGPTQGEGSSFQQADVAGSLVGIDGYWGFARPIDDAFVLARLGVPQPGVQVFLNSQPIGRTDAQGRVLIPQVSSFGRQEVSVSDLDLGIEFALRATQRIVALPYRSGAVVNFEIQKMRAVAGTAWQVDAGKRTPVAARSWSLAGPAGTLKIETSGSGEFYLEDAPAGRYTGTLQGRGRRYACRLEVPASQEAVQELKEGIVCE